MLVEIRNIQTPKLVDKNTTKCLRNVSFRNIGVMVKVRVPDPEDVISTVQEEMVEETNIIKYGNDIHKRWKY